MHEAYLAFDCANSIVWSVDDHVLSHNLHHLYIWSEFMGF